MIEYDKAREMMLAEITPVGTERTETAAACGHVLAKDVTARIDSPPFDKAAMDGYAVRRRDVQSLPTDLEVVGEVFAGGFPDFEVGPGQAAVITTGAPVPAGADMVVMVEHTERDQDTVVRVRRLSGGNICTEGEDIRTGDVVLRAGELMTPLRVGVAASAGHPSVLVHRRPTGALLCTGSEVVEPGEEPGPGQIYNSNGSMLSALMRPRCREFTYLGIGADRPEELVTQVRRGLESDILVITGGVSMGQYDLVPDALGAAGVKQVFHKVAVKPGKPTFFGTAGGTMVFGMPGNPQSCFVIFKMFVEPAVAAASGRAELPPRFEVGVMDESFDNKPGRMNVMPCYIRRGDGAPRVVRCPYHGSADIIGPAEADGYFIVPRGQERVEQGEELRFFTI